MKPTVNPEGEYCTKFYAGRLLSEVHPLILLYTIFQEKKSPLASYAFNQKWFPFHILFITGPYSE